MKKSSIFFFLIAVSVMVTASAIDAAFTRARYTINENDWKFNKSDVSGAEQVSFNDASWLDITIPHDWNGGSDGVNDDVFGGHSVMYRGVGWYRTSFTVDNQYSDKRIFIVFEGITIVSDVWLNGTHLGQHRGGYTTFKYDITDVVNFGADNVLAVKANNANDATVCPYSVDIHAGWPQCYDYAVYGGIYRDVWIEISEHAKVENVFNTPTISSAASATLNVRTEVKNYAASSQSVTLNTILLDAGGNEVQSLESTQSINAGQVYTFNQNLGTINNPHLWSIDDPYVYKVTSTLTVGGEEVDRYTSPTGFRWFTLVNGQAFSLNGQQMLIKGTNRHQDVEGMGYAVPNARHRKDMEMIKDVGFNFVRHAHYPPDPEILSATDSLGLMVWCELPATGSMNPAQAFTDNCRMQLTEMITQHYNHPSIVIWGLGNETDWTSGDSYHSEQDALDLFNDLYDLAHNLDPTGRQTTGCNFMQSWTTWQIFDVYAPQAWYGWYFNFSDFFWWEVDNPTELIGEYGADVHLPNHEEWDVVLADNGMHTGPFSQEWGLRIFEYYLPLFEEKKNEFPGASQWVAFDFASPRNGRGGNKIPYMNQKGIWLHDHETPKDSYYFYKSMYKDPADDPMVYIHSETWRNRWTAPASKDVWVYSNCEMVELYNNYGGSQAADGIRDTKVGERGPTRYQWDNIYVEYNVLYAEAYLNGNIVVRDTLILNNLPDPPVVDVKDGYGRKIVRKDLIVSSVARNGKAAIKVNLNETSKVRISIYTVKGELLTNIADNELGAGSYEYQWNAKGIGAGIYYVRCIAGKESFVRTVLLQ